MLSFTANGTPKSGYCSKALARSFSSSLQTKELTKSIRKKKKKRIEENTLVLLFGSRQNVIFGHFEDESVVWSLQAPQTFFCNRSWRKRALNIMPPNVCDCKHRLFVQHGSSSHDENKKPNVPHQIRETESGKV